MNPLKEEIRLNAIHEMGVMLDDQKEHCAKLVEQHVGAKMALVKTARHIEQLFAIADRELDEGSIPDLESLTLVKKWLKRSHEAVMGQAHHMELQEVLMRGRLDQASKAVDLLHKRHTDGRNRLQSVLQQLEEEEVVLQPDGSLEAAEGAVRQSGVRPAPSIAQQRKAEAAAKANGKDGEATVAPVEEEPKGTEKKTKRRRKSSTSKTKGKKED